MFRRAWLAFLHFAFDQFYNRFAFTYGFVSAVVSRGRWRAWTRAAIPRITGTRVLELAFGTGNLLLDLCAAGYAPIGVDLSPTMIRITQGKLKRAAAQHPERQSKQAQSKDAPRLIRAAAEHPERSAERQSKQAQSKDAPLLIRARAQTLPFAAETFDSVVMTFPPGFVYDPRVLGEIYRLLANHGRLVWVDAGQLLPRGLYSRLVNRAFAVTGGGGHFTRSATELLEDAGFETEIEHVQDDVSVVTVTVATKIQSTVSSRQSSGLVARLLTRGLRTLLFDNPIPLC